MKEIEISKIKTDPDQPRKHFDKEGIKALAESIKKDGLLQPITVTPLEDGDYRLVIGERRLRACKLLGWKIIKCLIIKDKETFILSLVENIHREDLSPIEEAEAYRKLLDSGLTQEELGKRIGKSQSQIAQKLALHNLPPLAQEMLKRKEISEGHGRQLLKFGKMLDDFIFPDRKDGKDFLMQTWIEFSQILSVSKLKSDLEENYYTLIYQGLNSLKSRIVGQIGFKSLEHQYKCFLKYEKWILDRGERTDTYEENENGDMVLRKLTNEEKKEHSLYLEQRIKETEIIIKNNAIGSNPSKEILK
jgi:ParB/RepB/Spo0J family partition protein